MKTIKRKCDLKAKLRNKVTGETLPVTSTNEHPDCSYGQSVWVDESGTAICVVGLDNPFYEVFELEVGDRVEVGQYLKMRRVSRGITVRGMAALAGLQPATIQNVEKGAFTPRIDVLRKILGVLGLRLVITP